MKLAVARLAAVLALCATALSAQFASPASAQNGVPIVDPSAQGSLTFCDRNNHSVTSGNVTDIPFVWKAVSSVAAPPAYTGPQEKATLYVYQPRKGIDPGEWSGRMMTASSTYTNPKAPVAQATFGDPPLIYFINSAPLWEGLIQVRMYLSNANTPPQVTPYPATVIRVAGKHWSVVSNPGTAVCSAGTAVSVEHILGATLPSAQPTYRAGRPTPTSSSTGEPSAAASSHATPTPTQANESPSVANNAVGSTTGSDGSTADSSSGGHNSSSSSAALVGVLLAIPILGVMAGLWLARRRSGDS